MLEWVLLALQGVLGVLAMGMVTKAFSLTEASLLAPIEFLRLPIVAGFAYVLFDQVSGFGTLVGGILIFTAAMIMARSARRKELSEV